MEKKKIGFMITSDLVIYSFLDLSKTLLTNSDAYKVYFENGTIFDFLYELDKYRTMHLRKIFIESDSFIVFCYKAVYFINPYLPFFFKGKRLNDFSSICQNALLLCPNIDPIVDALIKNKIFTYFLRIKGDISSPIFKVLKKIEEDHKINPLISYYEFCYLYTDDKSFVYHGNKYRSIEIFMQIMMDSEEARQFLADNFSRDYNYFLVSLYKVRKSDIIKDYENLISLKEEYKVK